MMVAGMVSMQPKTRTGRRLLTAVAIALPVAAMWLVSFNTVVRYEVTWVDSSGMSLKTQTQWRYGADDAAVVTVSPLAQRYREMGLVWEPQWHHAYTISRNVFGHAIGIGCSTPVTPIYALASNGELQEAIIGQYSNDELHRLFDVLGNGTEAERSAIVNGLHRQFGNPKR